MLQFFCIRNLKMTWKIASDKALDRFETTTKNYVSTFQVEREIGIEDLQPMYIYHLHGGPGNWETAAQFKLQFDDKNTIVITICKGEKKCWFPKNELKSNSILSKMHWKSSFSIMKVDFTNALGWQAQYQI